VRLRGARPQLHGMVLWRLNADRSLYSPTRASARERKRTSVNEHSWISQQDAYSTSILTVVFSCAVMPEYATGVVDL
jgi:hypothetical protein